MPGLRACAVWRAHGAACGLLLLLALLANAPAMIFNTDPTLPFSHMGVDLRAGLFGGPPGWLDPTVAYITQPVGHLVVWDWLHGILPWWNPYSGVGMPLAAQMQTEAFFFPFVLLLHWDFGWLLQRIMLQMLCGLFAYALCLELGLRRRAAMFGAGLFALSPLFFLDPHAAICPLPFLPLLLLGIEHAARAARNKRGMGWSLVVIATAYSILGGFPEVTYFDGLLAGFWAAWRLSTLPPARWPAFAGKIALGLICALGLCAPLLIPFADYLPHAYLGTHATDYFRQYRLDGNIAALQLLPFLYGPFGGHPPPAMEPLFIAPWVRLPGWVDLPVVLLVLASLIRRGPRVQPRLVLALWVALWEARYLGFAPAVWLLTRIPGLGSADSIRFSGPMIDFCLYLLAAYGLNDVLTLPALSRKKLAAVLAAMLLLLLAAILPVRGFLQDWLRQKPTDLAVSLATALALALLCAALGAELRRRRWPRVLLGLLLAWPCFELTYSQCAGFRSGHIDLAPIRFLQAHAGTNRMLSLGPFDLNFPSRYNLAIIDYAAMPASGRYSDYITAHLFAPEDRNIYYGGAPGQRDFVLSHLGNYAALGVRYLITFRDDDLTGTLFSPATAQARNFAYVLEPGGTLSGSVAQPLPFAAIKSISVVVGTYFGAAHGPLTATICAAGQCQSASADANAAYDNAALPFIFPAPLLVPPGATLQYSFTHPGGTRVAIWLAHAANGTETPTLSYGAASNQQSTGLRLVFRDETAAIYELPAAAPYAEAPGCRLTVLDRKTLQSLCPAPATLLRREMYDEGWRATVNGRPMPVAQAGLFQDIALPAGAASIRFTYAPPHIRLACALALLALGLWLGLGFSHQRR